MKTWFLSYLIAYALTEGENGVSAINVVSDHSKKQKSSKMLSLGGSITSSYKFQEAKQKDEFTSSKKVENKTNTNASTQSNSAAN